MKKWNWAITVVSILMLFSSSILKAQSIADGDGIIEPGEDPQDDFRLGITAGTYFGLGVDCGDIGCKFTDPVRLHDLI